MGGDLILNSAGQVAYIYRSKVSSDRPSVADIQQILKVWIWDSPGPMKQAGPLQPGAGGGD